MCVIADTYVGFKVGFNLNTIMSVVISQTTFGNEAKCELIYI